MMMKLFTETYESVDKVKQTIEQLFDTKKYRIVTKYVTDKNTQHTCQSMIIHLKYSDEYSSILFDINHNKEYNGIRFHIPNRYMIPPLYISCIHILVDIKQLFETFFGYDYIYKVVKMENKMDEDGNVPVIIYFNQSLPRTESLKNFYLEMYRSRYGYTFELEKNYGGNEIIHISRNLRFPETFPNMGFSRGGAI
jgi:hypothetical protein